MKNILITAGSTAVEIDQVRIISNIFSGRTGATIALYFARRGLDVTLLTSQPLLLPSKTPRLKTIKYKTYDDLSGLMEKEIRSGFYDTVIHSAAVSDFRVKQVLKKDNAGNLCSVSADKKISSNHSSLFLEMEPTEKIVDKIRQPWGFAGQLVKFKLEVGINDEELIQIGYQSRAFSQADYLVANCLEWSEKYAYIISEHNLPFKVSREALPEELMRRLI